MIHCEDCKFIRLAENCDQLSSPSVKALKFATCKASKNKTMHRISRMFHAEELQCSVVRESGECDDYIAKDDAE